MQQSFPRLGLLEAAVEGLSEAPAVALLGARQVGKTTLAAQVVAVWHGPSTVFDLEVAATREALSATPERVLRACEGLVVPDEMQRMPGLFEALRPICDDHTRKAVFLLLGSASWDLIKGTSERWPGAFSSWTWAAFRLPRWGRRSRTGCGCAAGSRGRIWPGRPRPGPAGWSRSRVRSWSGTCRGWARRCRPRHWVASGGYWRITAGGLERR